MDYLTFRNQLFNLACFSIDQIYAWYPGFDRNNLHRWVSNNKLIRLKRSCYTFPEYMAKPGYALYFANRIYKPSYISLQTALAFYGLIPEAVVQITSVSTLKTAAFNNQVAAYSYKSIAEGLMFGYINKPISAEISIQLASPEKAILDLLYLYPEYKSPEHMQNLRLDSDLIHEELNIALLMSYSERFKNKSLLKRLNTLLKSLDI